MFYVFRDGDTIRHAFYDVIPLDRAGARRRQQDERGGRGDRLRRSRHRGNSELPLGGFIFWVLGLSSPLLWGVVIFSCR